MKRLLLLMLAAATVLISCKNTGNGELTGVPNRTKMFPKIPYGMTYVPMGSYMMGTGDQDIAYSLNVRAKNISISAFYMDETEITNNEYRQFVYWVRDSLAKTILGYRYMDNQDASHFKWDKANGQPKRYGNGDYEYYALDWDKRIAWGEDIKEKGNKESVKNPLEKLFLPMHERYGRERELDTRLLAYRYWLVDLPSAAKKINRFAWDSAAMMNNRIEDLEEDRSDQFFGSYRSGIPDRSVFVQQHITNIYPDTLCWMSDFAYSYNEPVAKTYFWHPAYDEYPVVGVNWAQAKAFNVWRSDYMKSSLPKGTPMINEFRLPTEAEWEWAARGGYELSPYPWGGPYIRNTEGCLLANFKPIRGDYASDGGAITVPVASFQPNNYGLYDMAGNVAEWTEDAYDGMAYYFTWDMNPAYTYNAYQKDIPAMKRKVVRGGSWKDVGYFLQVSTRTYEYQDSTNCYTGFRSVQSYLGRQFGGR
ncbi:MAG: formylglycine-generating enzyme family protein [Bacteroidales bacterium]|nr:formylglycine-generating enzyme family protein [Bacteroidales bacterium]